MAIEACTLIDSAADLWTGEYAPPGLVPMAPELSAAAKSARRIRRDTPHDDIKRLLEGELSQLLDKLTSKLADDAEDALLHGEPVPSDSARDACLELAGRLIPHVVLAPQLKWGVFLEDTGAIALVLQSLLTDRRLTCRISRDGSEVETTKIDEHMHGDRQPYDTCKACVAKELAEWVIRRF